MSQKITAEIPPHAYISLDEAVAGALTSKDDQLLSLNNLSQAVLHDGTAPAFAVMVDKLEPSTSCTTVRAAKFTGGGTRRVIQDEAITPGARVSAKTGTTRVEALDAVTGGRSLGFKLTPTAGAQGDVIEIDPCVENLPDLSS